MTTTQMLDAAAEAYFENPTPEALNTLIDRYTPVAVVVSRSMCPPRYRSMMDDL